MGNSKTTSFPESFLYTPANVSSLFSVSILCLGSKNTYSWQKMNKYSWAIIQLLVEIVRGKKSSNRPSWSLIHQACIWYVFQQSQLDKRHPQAWLHALQWVYGIVASGQQSPSSVGALSFLLPVQQLPTYYSVQQRLSNYELDKGSNSFLV